MLYKRVFSEIDSPDGFIPDGLVCFGCGGEERDNRRRLCLRGWCLSQLPKPWEYAVEVRHKALLTPEYCDIFNPARREPRLQSLDLHAGAAGAA